MKDVSRQLVLQSLLSRQLILQFPVPLYRKKLSFVVSPVNCKMSDSEDETPDKQLKLVVMGDGASGKVI